MAKIASELLVGRLAEWGVDTVFGLPGDGIGDARPTAGEVAAAAPRPAVPAQPGAGLPSSRTRCVPGRTVNHVS